ALAACAPQATPTAVGTPVISAPYPTSAIAATSLPLATYPVQNAAATPSAAPTQGLPAPEPTSPADMTFEDYGVNPFVDTSEDHLSTFALDVDTASYALTRRHIPDGQLPPPEAVRVEEFVNAFEQGYTPPPDVAFAIYADGA